MNIYIYMNISNYVEMKMKTNQRKCNFIVLRRCVRELLLFDRQRVRDSDSCPPDGWKRLRSKLPMKEDRTGDRARTKYRRLIYSDTRSPIFRNNCIRQTKPGKLKFFSQSISIFLIYENYLDYEWIRDARSVTNPRRATLNKGEGLQNQNREINFQNTQ